MSHNIRDINVNCYAQVLAHNKNTIKIGEYSGPICYSRVRARPFLWLVWLQTGRSASTILRRCLIVKMASTGRVLTPFGRHLFRQLVSQGQSCAAPAILQLDSVARNTFQHVQAITPSQPRWSSNQVWRGYAAQPQQDEKAADASTSPSQQQQQPDVEPLSQDVTYLGPLAKTHKQLKVS